MAWKVLFLLTSRAKTSTTDPLCLLLISRKRRKAVVLLTVEGKAVVLEASKLAIY